MSALLEVVHTTTYHYARPVPFSAHRVLFHPRAAHDIRVLNARLTVTPESRQRWIHDVFSNSVAIVEPEAPADMLRFTAGFTIAHRGVMNRELPIAAEAEFHPFSYSADESPTLAGFIAAQYPDDAGIIADWVSSLRPQGGRTETRTLLSRINEAIRQDFRYAARDRMGTQRPAQTLAQRTGTCRDFVC